MPVPSAIENAASGTVLASASRGTSTDTATADFDIVGPVRGLIVVLDVTGGSGTVTAKIRGKDEVSGKYYDLLVSAAKASPTTTVLQISPDLTASANLIAQAGLPARWTVTYTVATAAVTFSIGYSYAY